MPLDFDKVQYLPACLDLMRNMDMASISWIWIWNTALPGDKVCVIVYIQVFYTVIEQYMVELIHLVFFHETHKGMILEG